MYKCLACDEIFYEPKIIQRTTNTTNRIYIKRIPVCPKCEYEDFKEILRCSKCKKIIDSDDAIYQNGNAICDDCFFEL